MKHKLVPIVACLLGLLSLPGIYSLAQRGQDKAKKVDFFVMVDAKPEKINGSFGLIPLEDVQIHLTLSNGQHLSSVTTDQGTTLFKGVPAGCEYVAEISPAGYIHAIYHGRVPDKIGFPTEFFTAKFSSESEKEPSFFDDPGPADVEGFVVCPSESFFWASEPLPDVVVLYASSADLLFTTTDQHGYFRFEGVKDKSGKVSVSYQGYKAAEATVPLEDGSRWLWVKLEKETSDVVQ